MRVLGTDPDPDWVACVPKATQVRFDVGRYDSIVVTAAAQALNMQRLVAAKGAMDNAMRSVAFPLERIRGPFPVTAAGTCPCSWDAVARALSDGATEYGVEAATPGVTYMDLSVSLTQFPHVQSTTSDIVVRGTIRREDGCGIDFRVSVGWQYIVDGRDVLQEWLATGAAGVADGLTLAIRGGHSGRPARVVLTMALSTSATVVEFSSAITFQQPRPIEVVVTPTAGVALSTVFHLAVGGCAVGEWFAFRFGDAQRQINLQSNTECGIATQLPALSRRLPRSSALSVVACRGTTGHAACQSAPVTVTPRVIDTSEVAATVETWEGLPFDELAQRAVVYMSAVNSLPPGNATTELKVDLLEMLGTSLTQANEGTEALSVQAMDRSAVPAGCSNATLLRTAVVTRFRSTSYGAGALSDVQAAVASALSVDASLVVSCLTDTTAATAGHRRALLQSTPTPTQTSVATPLPTAVATITSTALDANPLSPTPTAWDVAVYVGNVDPSQHGAVGQQLQALFSASALPVLQGITPPLKQAPGPLAAALQVASGLLASATSIGELHALQNAIALTVVPGVLDTAPYIPKELQEQVSDLLQALLSNVWKNTALQEFHRHPELVEREEKLQGIVAEHVSGLVGRVLQDVSREHASEVWPTGSAWLNFTSTFKIMSIDQVASTPITVGGTRIALGSSVQEFMTSQGYTEARVVAVEFAPIMDPSNSSAVEQSPLAGTRSVSQVTTVASVRVSGKRGPDSPWDDVGIEDQPEAIELQFQWVNFHTDVDASEHDFTTQCQFLERDPLADSHGVYLTNSTLPAGQWATRGCHPTTSSGAAVTCVCDHLTEFRAVTSFLPKPNVISLGDLVNIVRMNSPIIWYGLLVPVWLIAIVGCCWSQYRDRYRRREFISQHHLFAVLQSDGPGLSNPLAPRSSEARKNPLPIAYTATRETPHLQVGKMFDCYNATAWDPATDLSNMPSTRSLEVEGRNSWEPEFRKSVEVLQQSVPSCRTSTSEGIRPNMPSCCSRIGAVGTSCFLGDGDLARPVVVEPEKERVSVFKVFLNFHFRQHFHLSHLDYPITSNILGPVRILGWQCLLLVNVLLMGVWFSATAGSAWYLRIIQTVIIVLCNQMVMQPIRTLTIFPFLWCRPSWRIPCLMPCPAPPEVPAHALQCETPALDFAEFHWDAPTLKKLAEETEIAMLKLHLAAIAAVLDPGGRAEAPDDAGAVQDLLDGAHPSEVTDLYHVVLLSLQNDCQSLARRFLKAALLCANPDLCTLTDAPQFFDWSHDFLDNCKAIYEEKSPRAKSSRGVRPGTPTPRELADGPEISVPQLRELLAMDFVHVIYTVDPVSLVWDLDWDKGQEMVAVGKFSKALRVFVHSPPPGGLFRDTFQSTTVAVGLILIACHRAGVPEGDVLRHFRAACVRPLQHVAPRQWTPFVGGGQLIVGQATRHSSLAPLYHTTFFQGLRAKLHRGSNNNKYKYQQTHVRPLQCPSATLLLGVAFGLPRMVFVDCAADPNRQTGSRAHPFCDVPSALRHVRTGDTIVLLPGHYSAFLLKNVRCPYDAPLHIRGASMETVRVGHPNPINMQHEMAAVRLHGCTGVVVSCLTLCHAQNGVRVDTASSYIRLEHLNVHNCCYATDLPDRHNHVIEVHDVLLWSHMGRLHRFRDVVLFHRHIPEDLHPIWNVPFLLLVVGVSVAASILILAYAESFYRDEGNNSKVNAWVVASLIVVAVDAFVKQPLLVSGSFGVLYMLSL